MRLTAKLQAIAKHCIYEMQHCTMLCLQMRLTAKPQAIAEHCIKRSEHYTILCLPMRQPQNLKPSPNIAAEACAQQFRILKPFHALSG
jgi:hypothetical protein